MKCRFSPPADPPQPEHKQTRYRVNLVSGVIDDPDSPNSHFFYHLQDAQYRLDFTTRDAMLAKLVSEDIKKERIRALEDQIAELRNP